MGLGEADGFKVFKETIQTPGDGIIAFQGMQDHTAESIKSLEGFKRAWCEEAQSMSAVSLSLLRPTIRAEGSELWFSWNPRRKLDPVDKMLRGAETPTGSVVIRANWQDNPWFTAELEQERLDCIRMTPEQYGHIWDGEYSKVTVGAYYAQALTELRNGNRLGFVPADPLMTYRAYWDIGGTGAKADACCIWIVQFVGLSIRILDFYRVKGQPLAAHVNWLRSKGYGNALCVLPHDGVQHDKVHDATFESALRQAGFSVEVVKNQGRGAAMQRVEAVRRVMPRVWINEATTADGVELLGQYRENVSSNGVGLGPLHDEASDPADAFGLMAVAYEEPREKRAEKRAPRHTTETGWMGG